MKDSYDLRWFVLRVKPNHEKKVTQLLLELNFQAYNPIVKVKRTQNDFHIENDRKRRATERFPCRKRPKT